MKRLEPKSKDNKTKSTNKSKNKKQGIQLNEKYENLFKHTSRFFICTGGRASAKSFSVAAYIILLSFESGQKILYTRLTLVSAHISIIPELSAMIDLMGLSEHFEILKTKIVNKQSGSEILFLGLRTSNGDNTAKLKSITGINCWVCDEAEEIRDEALFDKVNLSIRNQNKQNRVIMILNPTTKNHWIYNRFFITKSVPEGFNGIKGDTCYIHTTYLDNKDNLSLDFIREVEIMKDLHPEKYSNIVLGGWLERAEGVIFSNWEYGTFPKDCDSTFCSDWGYSSDPSVIVEVFIDTKNMKIFVKQHLYQTGLNTSQLTKIFKNTCGNKLIIGDSAEARLIDEIKLGGVNIIPAKKGAGSVAEGIMLMKNYVIVVDQKSKDIANELNNYSWQLNQEKPIDRWNHAIDAIRYNVSHHLKVSNSEWFVY